MHFSLKKTNINDFKVILYRTAIDVGDSGISDRLIDK